MVHILGGAWYLYFFAGAALLAGVLAWALRRNRKVPKADLDRTERATHDRILEQDAIDKQRDTDART